MTDLAADHQTELYRRRRESERRRARQVALTFWIIAFLGTVGFLLWRPGDRAPEVLRTIDNVGLETFAGMVLFGVIYAWLTREDYDAIIQQALVLTLGGNEQLFKNLDLSVRKSFVGATLGATLGRETGGAVFDEVVNPLMTATTPYRHNFRYEITCLDTPPGPLTNADAALAKLHGEIANSPRYFWLEQKVAYDWRRPMGKERLPFAGPFVIGLAFDERRLENLMGNDNVFFREVIKLEPAQRDAILHLDNAALKAFIKQTLEFKVSARVGGGEVDYEVKIDSQPGLSPIISLVTAELDDVATKCGIEISFRMPQLREITRFVVALPQPTQNPRITFTRAAHMTRLEPVRYMSRIRSGGIEEHPHDASDDPAGFTIAATGWTFPTSGVMFVWENRA